jgi:pimeloyl-ACP methyl ester carboxylesterase
VKAPRTKPFGAARIVGLALISLTAIGLAFLHFGTGKDTVSVPSGAKAGQLTLHACDYAGDDRSYPADCGTLIVRENRHNPDSRLIALPVTRIRAQSSNPGAPVFGLIGGPGHSNIAFKAMSRFATDHDVVLVGYRGVDGSVRLDCPEVVDSREHSRDWLSTASLESDADAFRACADRLRDDGVDLAGYTLPQRVDDLELARRKLGYGPIDLVSESFGTRIAMIYAWRYPKSIHRSVMVGVNPPGHFLWNAKTTREQIRRYAALCAEDESCRARTGDLAASVESGYDRIPSRWWFLPIKKDNVRTATLFGLFNATPGGGGPLAGPSTLDTLLSVDKGDASGAWLLSFLVQAMFPRVQVAGDVAAMGRTDAAYAKRFFASRANRGSAVGTDATKFIWAGGRLVDAWPANPDEKLYNHVRDSSVETLLIGGELDFSTPPQVATRELLPHLENGHQVVLPKLGHTEDFWAYQRTASTRLIDTFLDSGKIDTSHYTENRIDFTPSVTHGELAKIVLGVMLGLAALTVLSLLWMPLRVRRFGAFGRKAGAALRAVYVPLLGLGGWVAGVLVALTALPTVPLQDEVLALVSISIPVAVGTYWASRGEASEGTRTARFVATVVSAVFGAWLGFHVTAATLGMVAPVLAIVGATAAANLTVLVLDIRRDRAAREAARVAAPLALTEASA